MGEGQGSRFVELPAERAAEALQEAQFVVGGSIQIFRFWRPRSPPMWVVADVMERGGLLVRREKKLTSPALEELLMAGSRVAELELSGNRMRFRKVRGES